MRCFRRDQNLTIPAIDTIRITLTIYKTDIHPKSTTLQEREITTQEAEISLEEDLFLIASIIDQ